MDRVALYNVLCLLQNAGLLTSQISECGDNYYSISCLFAKDRHEGGTDMSPSMTVEINPDGPSVVRCHMCGYRKSLIAALTDLNVLTYGSIKEIVDRVREEDKIKRVSGVKRSQQKKIKIFDYSVEFEKHLANGLPQEALDFLATKGCPENISHDLSFAWLEKGIGTKRDGTEFKVTKCLLIPILSRVDGYIQCVGVQARPIKRKIRRSKYFLFFRFSMGLFLYGEHLLDSVRGKRLFVLEGPLDTAHFISEGEHAVGLMGLFISKQKLAKIVAAQPRVVYVMLDPDQNTKEGQKRWISIVEYIRGASLSAFGVIPPKDPKLLSRQEIQSLVGGVK